jgi:hypothetical protein
VGIRGTKINTVNTHDIRCVGTPLARRQGQQEDIGTTVESYTRYSRLLLKTRSKCAQGNKTDNTLGSSSTFRPIRSTGLVIVQAKLILQELRKCQVEWDDAVPHNIRVAWLKFQEQLRRIHQVTIPTRVTIEKSIMLQIHGIADASERAYGACMYLRSTDNQNKQWSHLLCSKSRVAPLKMQSLPRLEF